MVMDESNYLDRLDVNIIIMDKHVIFNAVIIYGTIIFFIWWGMRNAYYS